MHSRVSIFLAAAAAALMSWGCDRTAQVDAQPTVVDSVVPREIALARFREGLPEVPSLGGGASSRDALIRQFVAALAAGDTATLRSLVMTRAEFAWLLYPTSSQSLPPYDLSPSLYWFLIEGRTRQGLAALLDERSGARPRFAGFICDARTTREGANTIHGPCTVARLDARGDTIHERLFGLILERGGRFKFISLAGER